MIVDTSIVVALAAREPSSAWIHRSLDAMPTEPLRMAWVNIAEAGMVLERAAPRAANDWRPRWLRSESSRWTAGRKSSGKRSRRAPPSR